MLVCDDDKGQGAGIVSKLYCRTLSKILMQGVRGKTHALSEALSLRQVAAYQSPGAPDAESAFKPAAHTPGMAY